MSVAAKAWRSFELLVVVLLGIVSALGSGGGGEDPIAAFGCGSAIQTNNVSVADKDPAAFSWVYADPSDPGISNLLGSGTQWSRLGSDGAWVTVFEAADRTYTLAPAIFRRDNNAQFKVVVTFTCARGIKKDAVAGAFLEVTPKAISSWVDVDAQEQSTRPSDTTVGVAGNAIFVAMAYGDNTYQWQRSNDDGAHWADVAGATDWELVVGNVQTVDDAALFRLRATNRSSNQTIFSRAARLTVNGWSDADFADANWTTTKIYDTTAASDATVTATQQTSGGNPGAFRKTTQQWTGGNGVSAGLEAAHLLSSTIHDPARDGAIDHVDFSFDVIVISQQGGTAGVAIFPLLVQNGVYFQYYDAGNPVVWTHKTFSGLTATDFVNASAGARTGPLNPDFSSSGALIQFGYATANGSATGVPMTTVSGVDNWNVVLTLR
jgi:hypothetical protein